MSGDNIFAGNDTHTPGLSALEDPLRFLVIITNLVLPIDSIMGVQI